MAKKQTTRSKTSSSTKTVKAASTRKTSKLVATTKKTTKSAAAKSAVKSKATAGKTAVKPATKKKVTKSTVVASKPAKAAKAVKPTQKKKSTKAKTEPNPFKVNFSQNSKTVDREPFTEEQLRKVKTGLSKKDLNMFTTLLLQKRAELSGDVESLRADAKNAGANISYEHMADTGSDNYEQEFTLGLVESERQLLNEIDEALLRIERGYYGVCVETGEPINRARLEAKPWAKYCIEVAREKERHSAPRFKA